MGGNVAYHAGAVVDHSAKQQLEYLFHLAKIAIRRNVVDPANTVKSMRQKVRDYWEWNSVSHARLCTIFSSESSNTKLTPLAN